MRFSHYIVEGKVETRYPKRASKEAGDAIDSSVPRNAGMGTGESRQGCDRFAGSMHGEGSDVHIIPALEAASI